MRNQLLMSFYCFLCCGAAANAAVYRLTPQSDWFSVLNGDRLMPGDEVILAEGEYRDRRRLVLGHRGAAERPIVIRAAANARVVLHRPDAKQNTINIVGSQYLILRGLEITGGSSGIRMMKSDRVPCKFVTIEEMHIHHVGGVAITANSPGNTYEGLVFRRNHIHHTSGHGEGFYLGVNNNADGTTAGVIFDSIVENNYIHDLKGPNVSQGDGIEIKDGSYHNIIRDNVIHDTNYPGVIVYGTDGKSRNVIERNVIWNSNDHGIQAAADAIIRNNIVFDNRGDGIHSHPHQSAMVGDLDIVHNTVVTRRPSGSALRISISAGQQLTGPIIIANNAFYAPGGGFALRLPVNRSARTLITLAGNVGEGTVEGLGKQFNRLHWNPKGRLTSDLDLHYFPRNGSMLIGEASPRFITPMDFDATPRKTPGTTGAYTTNDKTNPKWPIASEFKPFPDHADASR